MKRKNYIDQQELFDEYKKSKEMNRCTERLGMLFMILTDHMLRGPRFIGYSKEVKEDLKGCALIRLIKSIDNVNISFTPQQIFNFATRTTFTAFLTELKKHYKFENTKRELTKKQILESELLDESKKEDMLNEIWEFEKSIGLRS